MAGTKARPPSPCHSVLNLWVERGLGKTFEGLFSYRWEVIQVYFIEEYSKKERHFQRLYVVLSI